MDYRIKKETLTGIADIIRSKTGKTEKILAADFEENIGGIDTSKPEETKEVSLDFSGGDMEVVPTTGSVFSKVSIPQPENLLPENIKSGQIIAGIEGTLANQTILENIPIALDFSNGNQTIEAAEGTLVKSATIQKPETLIPENIAEGIDIAGIIGTLAAGGGSVDTTKTFFKTMSLSVTTATQQEIASVSELAAAGITLNRGMPLYSENSDMVYIGLVRIASSGETSGIVHSFVSNIASVYTSSRYYVGATLVQTGNLKVELVNTATSYANNLYPVSYGSLNAGVEVTETGSIQVKMRNTNYAFKGNYMLIVIYKSAA